MESKELLAKEIRESGEWQMDKCRELCVLAGMENEWDKADGETFEKVVTKAADILGVEIF